MKRWHALGEELGCDIQLEQDGYLWVALKEDELQMQRDLAARDAPYGIQEFVLDREEIQRMAPVISDMVIGGLWCPTDCLAYPFYVTRGYLNAARRLGARFSFGAEVLDLVAEGNRITGVVTDQGPISCDTVVAACGPWTDRVGNMAGIEIPLIPCPNQFVLTEAVPPILPRFLLISGIAVCRQSTRGNVFIGNTNAPGGIGGCSKATDYAEMVRTLTNILKIVPAFRGLHIIRTWVGTIDFSPDDNFIFGRVDEVEGLVVACGFSGHGFAITPILGQLLSELIVDGKTSLPVEAFHLNRFKTEPVKKAQHFAHQHVDTA
jgi:sarcosine oxidase subunit beta